MNHSYLVIVPLPAEAVTDNELKVPPTQTVCGVVEGWLFIVGNAETVIVPVAFILPQPPVNGML